MEVLKNVLMNWVLPVVVLFIVLTGYQAFTAPEVELDGEGLAPDFTLMDTSGAPVSLSNFRGQEVVVNFWGTWCGPCKAELPGLNRFARKNPNVVVLGLAVDSGDPPELLAAKGTLDIPFEVLDCTGKVKRQWGVTKVPTTFLVDGEGVLRKSHVGVITPVQLAAWVD
ncbi:MAG: TlpA family protein disulfide reductase [Proteobacteria bacterium]|nr:TlpA family protein disulfide reductase [Pseudomonadota bacterium]